MIITSGDGIYKLDYNKVLEYHIAKRADITVVCTECRDDDPSRFGVLKMKRGFPYRGIRGETHGLQLQSYLYRHLRDPQETLIELIERCAQEDRHDFVKDILIRYKNLKRIYGYKLDSYWEQYFYSGILLPDQYGFPEARGEGLLL